MTIGQITKEKTLDFCVKKLRTENKANDICVFVLHNKIKPKLGCLENINYISLKSYILKYRHPKLI